VFDAFSFCIVLLIRHAESQVILFYRSQRMQPTSQSLKPWKPLDLADDLLREQVGVRRCPTVMPSQCSNGFPATARTFTELMR
jgi:hypothetical protein